MTTVAPKSSKKLAPRVSKDRVLSEFFIITAMFDEGKLTEEEILKAIFALKDGAFRNKPAGLEESEEGKEDIGIIDLNLPRKVERVERRIIEIALLHARGNRRIAANLLGISLRTLFYKINKYTLV